MNEWIQYMTELSDMTIKDLRKLASDHKIPGRSGLAKQDLLSALGQLLKNRQAGAVEETAKKAPAHKAEKATTTKKDIKKPHKKTSKKVVEKAPEKKTPAQEPEVLDASLFVEAVAPEASTTSKKDAVDTAASKPEEKIEEKTEDGAPRRRRRRSRGGKKKTAGQVEQSAESSDAEQSVEQVAEKTDETQAKTVEQPASDKAEQKTEASSASASANKNTTRGGQRDERRNDRQQRPPRDPHRPHRPRLEGNDHRRLPGMIDRMISFTSGIVGLCDPETPSWAQAHLSELLAEAGVCAMPCSGLPHPDYHEVVGEYAVEGIPAGHITSVEIPGFCLRGDRGGRLFPVQKSKVNIAPGTVEDVQAETEQPTVVAEEATAAELPVDTLIEEAAPSVEDTTAAEPAPEPAPESADKADSAADSNSTEKNIQQAEEAASAEKKLKEAAEGADVDAPVADRQETKQASRKSAQKSVTQKQSRSQKAERLPLVQQSKEELADRPQAEGFRALGLNDQVLADVAACGYSDPSPIQEAAIPITLTGVDIIGQAQTGTGKTAAFVLPILHKLYELEPESDGPVALMCCPTRELARQVHAEFVRMAGQSSARAALIYGGVSMQDQFDALDRKPHVVIGTPGRIIDLIKRGSLKTSNISIAVLDEADQMLDIGFLPDIEYILSHTPPARQTLLFSATMPDEIRRLVERFQKNPEHIHMAPKHVTADQVDQKYIAVEQKRKVDILAHYIETEKPEQLVVFCKTKHQTDRVATILKKKKMKAGAIHGDLPQNKRERTLTGFRNNELQCLIATNVAARGLDIPAVSHVINYDIPENPEEYVHRIGRTGRMGSSGFARTFITPDDGQFLIEIEKHIGFELEEETIEGITTHSEKSASRPIADMEIKGPRLLKPIAGGIRLGRRRRR